MVRIYQLQKSIYKPRFSGPFKVIDLKSSGNFIVVKNSENISIERNIADVKRCQPLKETRITYQAIDDNSRPNNPILMTQPNDIANFVSFSKCQFKVKLMP